ncbi:MAG: hypothetical protein ACTSPV_05070, partial [Candidatus Hodarchaeales archaeon]
MSKDLYSSIGLSDLQYEIYSIISSKLSRSLEEIELLTNKTKDQINEVISDLEEKKFIRVIPTKVPQFVALTPPIAVSGEINKHLAKELDSIQEEVERVWTEIEKEIFTLLDDFKDGLLIFTSSQKNLIKLFEEIKDSLFKSQEEAFNNSKLKVEQAIEEINNNNNTALSDYLQNFKKQIQDQLDHVNDQFTQLKEKLDNNTKTSEDLVDKLHKENHDRLETFLNNLVKIVKTLEEKNQQSHQELSEFLEQIHEQLLTQNIASSQEQITEIKNLSDEIFPKLSDKFTILKNSLDNIENELLQIQEETFQSFLSSSKGFTKDSISKSLNTYLKEFEQLIKKDLQSFFQSLGELFEQLDSFNKNFKPTEFEEIITSEFTKEKETVTETLTHVKDNFTSVIVKFNESIGQTTSNKRDKTKEELSRIISSFSNELQKEVESLNDILQSYDQAFLEKLDSALNSSTNKLAQLKDSIKEKFKETLESYSNAIIKTFKENNNLIQTILETFDKASDSNLIDISTSIDTVNLKIKDIINERKSKLEQIIQYLQNVSIEELDSYSTSINLMFGQMGTTVTEGVASEVESVSKNIRNLNANLDENLKNFSQDISIFVEESHNDLINTITDFNGELVTKLSDDIKFINNAVQELTNNSDKIKNEKISNLGRTIDDFNEQFEKINLNIRKSIPTSLDEIQARNLDDLNSFDRAFKKEFNKLMLRLNEIDSEVQSRLGKRVSLGKGGFEDIGQIVSTAKSEFQIAQKRLDKMIEEQIENFEKSNNELAEKINSSLNKQQLQTERLFVSITDTINESIDELYTKLIDSTKSFADKTVQQIQSSIKSIQTGSQTKILDLLNKRSKKQKDTIEGFMSKFRENYRSYQEIEAFPSKIEAYIQSEMNNFNETLQLALKTTIETSKSQLVEVINNSLRPELETLYTQLEEQDLTKTKEFAISTLKNSAEKTKSSLSNYISQQNKQKSNLSKQGQSYVTEISNVLENKLEETTGQVNGSFEALSDFQTKSKTKLQNDLNNGIFKLKDSVLESLESLTNELETSFNDITTIIEDTNKSFETIVSKLNEDHDKIKASLDSLESTFLTEFNQKLGSVSNVLTSIRDDSLNKLKISKDKFNSQIEQEFKKFSTLVKSTSDFELDIKNKVKTIEKTLNKKVKPLQTSINKTRKNFESDIKELIKIIESDIKLMKKNLEQRAIQQKQENETLFENYKTKMNSFIDSSRTIVEQLGQQEKSYNQELESLQRYLDECKETQLRSITETNNDVTELFTEFSTNLGQLTSSVLANSSKSVELLQSKSSTTLSETLGTFVSHIKKFNEENISCFNENLTKTSVSIDSKVREITKEFQTRSEELKGTSVKNLDKSIKTIPTRLNSHLNELTRILGLLETVQQTAS